MIEKLNKFIILVHLINRKHSVLNLLYKSVGENVHKCLIVCTYIYTTHIA